MLEVEDSVGYSQKKSARSLVQETIPMVAKGGAQIQVRINSESELANDDMKASVHQNLGCLVIPKMECTEYVKELGREIDKLERERGIETGQIGLSLYIETPKGLTKIPPIAMAS